MQPFWMCFIKSDVTLKLHGGNVSSTFTSQETVLLLRLYQVLNTRTLLWFTALLETVATPGLLVDTLIIKVLFRPSVCNCDVTVTQKPGPAHRESQIKRERSGSQAALPL